MIATICRCPKWGWPRAGGGRCTRRRRHFILRARPLYAGHSGPLLSGGAVFANVSLGEWHMNWPARGSHEPLAAALQTRAHTPRRRKTRIAFQQITNRPRARPRSFHRMEWHRPSPPICNGICFFFALGSKLKLAKGARAGGGFIDTQKVGFAAFLAGWKLHSTIRFELFVSRTKEWELRFIFNPWQTGFCCW
jgi:hypothetical protein